MNENRGLPGILRVSVHPGKRLLNLPEPKQRIGLLPLPAPHPVEGRIHAEKITTEKGRIHGMQYKKEENPGFMVCRKKMQVS